VGAADAGRVVSVVRWYIFSAVEWLCGRLGHPEFICRHIADLWVWADPELHRTDVRDGFEGPLE